MNPIEFFFELSIQPVCEIVGKWLSLKAIVQLDSAVCSSEKRSLLHDVFQSPFCVVCAVSIPRLVNIFDASPMYEWMFLRKVRLEMVYIEEQTLESTEKYLRLHGKHIRNIVMQEFKDGTCETMNLIARDCCNITSLHCELCDEAGAQVNVLKQCAMLHEVTLSRVDMNLESTNLHSANANLTSVSIDECDASICERLLDICSSASLQRLRIPPAKHVADWSRFTSLRYLMLQLRGNNHHTLVAQICGACPWITHLQIVGNVPLNISSVHLPRLCALSLRDTCIEDADFIQFVQSHSSTLEALELIYWGSTHLNAALQSCPNLRTIMFPYGWLQEDNCTMMGAVTKLIVCFPKFALSWQNLPRYCSSLQHLYLMIPRGYYKPCIHTAVKFCAPFLSCGLFISPDLRAACSTQSTLRCTPSDPRCVSPTTIILMLGVTTLDSADNASCLLVWEHAYV